MEQTYQTHSRVGRELLSVKRSALRHLVDHFYSAARADEILGPVFAAHVDNWEHHLDTMVDFWASAGFQARLYRGQPLVVHHGVPEIETRHFQRWLTLFSASLDYCLEPEAAEHLRLIASRMGYHMSSVLCAEPVQV